MTRRERLELELLIERTVNMLVVAKKDNDRRIIRDLSEDLRKMRASLREEIGSTVNSIRLGS